MHVVVHLLDKVPILSYWMTYLVLGMRQASLVAPIEELVDITVGMVKMLEQFAEVS